MNDKSLEYYIESFKKMNRAIMRGRKAPHKPILLLSIMHLIRRGIITSNDIELSNELIEEFKAKWETLIGEDDQSNKFHVAEGLEIEVVHKYPFKCSIENPYYHMVHEPFWQLVKSDTFEERGAFTSIKKLRSNFKYAEMDEELFLLMQNHESGNQIEKYLINLVQ